MTWKRMIALVDMNAFFASIEQRDNPLWRARPIGVTNGMRGSCIITCSYEARAFGIKTGMRLYEARQRCPELIQVPANPKRYASVSAAIMQALNNITPDIEIFSVDEAFLDLTHCQKLWQTPEQIGHAIKKTIKECSQIPCSVGISGDKTTAKFAAKKQKPNGLTIIPPEQAANALSDVLVTELCGIAKGIGRFLAQYGVIYCKDMQRIPVSVLARRFGNPGRRIWLMAQGRDPEILIKDIKPPKSLGHSKVMPPGTCDSETVLIYIQHMVEKVAQRLRRHQLQGQHFFAGVRSYLDGSWLGGRFALAAPCNDGKLLFKSAKKIIFSQWGNTPLSQVQFSVLDPKPESMQLELFTERPAITDELNHTIDAVNQRFGELALSPARLINRSDMPNVIAPAWKPDGHRQTI
jgi:DNA polymerase IV